MPHSTTVEPAEYEQFAGKTLVVNDGPLELSRMAPLRPSRPDEPLDDLRNRYEEDGYLFLKGLLPRDDVLKARENYFRFLSPSGLLKPGSEPVDGIYDSSKPISAFPGIGSGAVGKNSHPGANTAVFVDRALEAHTQDWYAEDFCKHPDLKAFIAKFTDWGDNTLQVTRSLLRNNIPGVKAIGVHYDQIFLRYGEPTSVTAWVPMGDINVQGGGLIYLEKGYTIGKETENDFFEKAKAAGMTQEEAKYAFNRNMMDTGLLTDNPAEFGKDHNRRWLLSSYEAGDVVLHNAFMIHASTINHDPEDKIRLATDLRFVDSSREWDTRWQKHYELADGL